MPTRRPDPPLLAFARPFTTAVVNRLTRLFAGHLPGFAIVDYRGRRSGKAYRTPMNVFRDGDDYVFALTYGSDAQWVKNVLAAGECDLEVRGKRVHLIEPELFADPSRHLMPARSVLPRRDARDRVPADAPGDVTGGGTRPGSRPGPVTRASRRCGWRGRAERR